MSFTVGMFTPVYYDDMLYPLTASRFFYDGGKVIGEMPKCAYFATSAPLLLLPGRWIAWAVHAVASNHIIMRVIAVAIAWAWVVFAAWAVRRLLIPHAPRLHAFGLVAALAGLGMMPFMLLQNRPETAMLLSVLFFLMLPFIHRLRSGKAWETAVVAVLLLVGSWFFSSHPKTLFFVPFVAVACACVPFKSKILRILAITGVLCIAAQSWPYWHEKITCPESRRESGHVAMNVLTGADFFADPVKFAGRFAANLEKFPKYLDYLRFNEWRIWMVRLIPDWHSSAGNILINLTASGLLGLALFALLLQIRDVVFLRHPEKRELALSLCLLAATVSHLGLNIIVKFYHVAFLLFSVLMLLLLTAKSLKRRQWFRSSLPTLMCALCAVSIVSQLCLISYTPAIVDAINMARSGGRVIHNMRSPVFYEETERQILEVAASCGIPSDSSARHVLVDLSTYVAMRKTYQPFSYLLLKEFPKKKRLLRYLRKNRSSGVITRCGELPEDILEIAQKKYGLCCLGPKELGY